MKKQSELTVGLKGSRKHVEMTAATGVVMAMVPWVGVAEEAVPAEKKKTEGAENTERNLAELVVDAEADKKLYKPERLASPKFVKPVRDVAQTMTVVPEEVLKEQGASSLRDVLRNVPGISMQAGEGGGGPAGDNFSIRGFAARSDIFVDGLRDTSSGGYSRDPFNLEQVEISKGPASVNSGRGSTGGSVNLVTKSPRLEDRYEIMLGGGSDAYGRGTFDLNQKLPWGGGAAVRLNGVYHDQEIPGRDGVENHRWGIAPSFAYGLGTDTRLTVSFMHLEQDNVPDYGIPWVARTSTNPALPPGLPPVDFDEYYGSYKRDYEKIETDLITARLEHDINDSLKAQATVRYGRNDRDSVTTAPRFTSVNTSSTINRQMQARDQVDTTWGAQFDLRYDVEIAGMKHQMVLGAEATKEDSDSFGKSQYEPGTNTVVSNWTTDLFNPDPHQAYPYEIRRNGSATWTEAETLALYWFDTVEFDKHWSVTGGVRYDHFGVDYRNRSTTGTIAELDREDGMWSYRASVNYKPVEEGTIYLGYGNSYNPSTEGLSYIAAPSGTNTTASLFESDPEETRTIELGAKWEFFDQGLLISGALFRTEKTNSRTVDAADPTVVMLTGEQVVQGVEFGFTGRITDSWRLIGGYTYLDSEVKKSAVPAEVGNEVSQTPEHSFSLWTVHDLPKGFQVGVGTQYVGARYNNSNETSRQKAEDYALLDAMVGYDVNENLNLRLNLYNLTDKDYIDRLGGGHFIPGQGRSVVLSANYTF